MSEVSAYTVAELLPIWVELESERYATAKYGNNNPQLDIMRGALHDPTAAAYNEFPQYLGRFSTFYKHEAFLKASQALGKYLNAGRSLLSVLVSENYCLPRLEARNMVVNGLFDSFSRIRFANPISDFSIHQHFTEEIEPRLASIANNIDDADLSGATTVATDLLLAQAQLMVDFTCETGVLATPGVSSTDEKNQLTEWFA